eukprot:72548_1
MAIQFYESVSQLIANESDHFDHCHTNPCMTAMASKLVADAVGNTFNSITLDSILDLYLFATNFHRNNSVDIFAVIDTIDAQVFATFMRISVMINDSCYFNDLSRYYLLKAINSYWNYDFKPLQKQMNSAGSMHVDQVKKGRQKNWRTWFRQLSLWLLSMA